VHPVMAPLHWADALVLTAAILQVLLHRSLDRSIDSFHEPKLLESQHLLHWIEVVAHDHFSAQAVAGQGSGNDNGGGNVGECKYQ